MARKTYSEEFRRQAVDLYESTAGATFRGIAADLGISRHTLQDWVTTRGSATAGATASPTATTPTPTSPAGAARPTPVRPGSPAAELAAMRARVQALEAENALLSTERDILRQAG